jgi:hypothetical protein
MQWIRSNIRTGSRLALLALAFQFVLSFGHVHGHAAPASTGFHDADSAGAHFSALHKAVRASAAGSIRLKNSSGDEPAGHLADDCAICAVMALASAMTIAASPGLPSRESAAFRYSTADTGLLVLSSARVAFQPRAPPIV